MLLHLLYAIALVFGTVLIHATATVLALEWLRTQSPHHWSTRNSVMRAVLIAGLVFMMSVAAYLEAWLWAGFLWFVDALPTLQEALYFSLVTFTTLGYGDVTLGEEWRILAALEAVNGIIIFGWTTAIIVAAAHRLFFYSPSGEGDP